MNRQTFLLRRAGRVFAQGVLDARTRPVAANWLDRAARYAQQRGWALAAATIELWAARLLNTTLLREVA